MPITVKDPTTVIGIMGGMGPEATVELMRQIIRRTPARDDADHVRMLVDNNPKIPSRIAFLLEGGKIDPTAALVEMARGLERGGATVIVIACNTAHAFAGSIRAEISVPFVDMIDSALDDVRKTSKAVPIRFGVLGSPALRRIGIFDRRCEGTDLLPVYSDAASEDEALAIIRAVKAGDLNPAILDRYLALKHGTSAAGAEAILVCCTEFSILEERLAERKIAQAVPTLDSMTSLVDRLICH